MTKHFASLLDGFFQANNDAVRSVIFEEMEEYAYSYRPDYTCYDMDMYVALYKCAKTSQQRKHVLEHIQSIIVDNAFQYYDELIQNFKDFIQMREFLNENDVEEFDAICKKALNFFEKQKEESEFEASAGQADFVPFVYPWEARKGLKEVAGIIVSTDMHNLESYHDARLVLEHSDLLAVSISHSFFFLLKLSQLILYFSQVH